jgi:radical SAM superfamily enzyme YgiQ (UPF0313 family)/wyosine [tRNA(Phe)-imidazoG37] synthetase (radical SAM superfamily)
MIASRPDVFLVLVPPFGLEAPPLGLACIAAALRAAGRVVCVRDFNVELHARFTEELGHLWAPENKAAWVFATRHRATIAAFGDAFDRLAEEIADAAPAIAGFSVHSDNLAATIELIGRVRSRRPATKIIVGGMGVFSARGREAFPAGLVDAFAVGEGERTVVELVDALLAGRDADDVAGVAAPGKPFRGRPVAESLDDFPIPNFADFDLTKYATPNLPIAFSRGCVKGCALCGDRALMGRFRTRKAESVFAEIKRHVETLGARDFMVVDLQITQMMDEVVRLAEFIAAAGIEIRWNANAAVGPELTPAALAALRRAGCTNLTLGVESGSDAVLRRMNKGVTAQQAAEALRAVKGAGLRAWINIVVGFPGETEENVAETLAWLEANAANIDEVGVLNTCNVPESSALAVAPAKYGICEPLEFPWADAAWVGLDGNTPDVRRGRLRRVKALLDRLGIPVRQTNGDFVDEASDLAAQQYDALLVVCPPDEPTLPSLAIASAASFLARSRARLHIVDLNYEEYERADESKKRLWENGRLTAGTLAVSPAELATRVLQFDAPVLCFALTASAAVVTREVVRAVRASDPARRIVIFGDTARQADDYGFVVGRDVDFIVIGDPEETLAEIVRRRGEPYEFLRGARFVAAAGESNFLPREPIRDLGSLGFPTFEEFAPRRRLGPALPIRFSRGCPRRCAFCGEQPAAGPFRARRPAAVLAEMIHHHETWGVTEFRFADLIVNGDAAALEELCDLLGADGRPWRWTAQAAPDAALTPALLAKMARAGCARLRFGVESFSNALLARMNKPYDGLTATANLRDAHAAGIETRVNLLIGFPGETEADFLATAKALREGRAFIGGVDGLAPCEVPHGSLLERECANHEVLLPSDWPRKHWSHRGCNNLAWRRKRAGEMAAWIAGLDLVFDYDFHLPPGAPLRKIEGAIRERLRRKTEPPPAAVLVALPPWGWENPPVGLAYLAAALRAADLPARVLDCNITFYRGVPESHRRLWHVENKNYWSNDDSFAVIAHILRGQIDAACDELVRLAPPLVGFSVVDPKERLTIEFIRRFRERNQTARIILGGPACFTPEYRQIFIDRAGDLIDGYCIGEGEQTLVEAVRRTIAGESLAGTPGLMTLDESRACVYTPRPPLADLDRLAPPTYEEFDLAQYPGDSLILEWSRGCVGNCAYCKGRQISGAFRMRSAAHIFAELRRHVETLGCRNFTIADNVLNGDPAILEELCDRLLASGLQIRWNGEALPLASATRGLLDKMARAGCREIQWGLESASPNVLRRMGKARCFTVDEARRVIRDSHEAGVKTCLFMIVGFPGEEREDFAETLRFVRENAAWIDQIKSINTMHVITGTALHQFPDRFGIELPAVDYHYLWRSLDGRNLPAERNRRARELLALCRELRIEVLETNIAEGKQEAVAVRFRDASLPLDERERLLIADINDLRSFALDGVEAGDRAGPAACSVELPDSHIAIPTPEDDAKLIDDNRALAGVLDGERVFAGPEILEIDLTNFCNLDCVGCWNHSPLLGDRRMTGEEKQLRLPAEMVFRLIDDAADMGAKQVQLSGAGDPLCHPDVLAIVERIKARGLECTLVTNGTLLTEAVCRRLVELGLDRLTVSVWAGTPKVYAAVHPNQPPQTLAKIKKSLQFIHALKAERGVHRPQVKVYNVVCHLNAGDVDAMIGFAVEALAEHVEFTPVDVVPGRTDELALTDADRAAILQQLNDLPKRPDYLELDPQRGPRRLDADGEGLEFARFVKRSILPPGFRYVLDDITRFDVLCPRKEWRLDVREDNAVENALLFFYPREECLNCPDNPKCAIDKERFVVKVEFTSFLGYGAFLRRIRSGAGAYDAGMIDETPCCIGWTYARVKTDASVIPCCKADDLPLGNLQTADFRAIWGNAAYAEFRRRALTQSKRDPYFAPIDCAAACDNLGHNLATQERLQKLTDDQRRLLRQHAARHGK